MLAEAATAQGMQVVAVGHVGETDQALAASVEHFSWVRTGQVNRILRTFRKHGVSRAVMAGGFTRMRAFAGARPDFAALRIASRLRSFRDDALLREIARYFEESGIHIVAPTQILPSALAPEGLLAGPDLTEAQRADIQLGVEVAQALGRADVGQTVVVQGGHVLALEAVEGTDEAIRRGGRLAMKPGGAVVKLCKPAQDERFDLPAVGPQTMRVMHEMKLSVLAVHARKSVLLDLPELASLANRWRISVWGIAP